MAWTTTDLLRDVREYACEPDEADGGKTDAVILGVASAEQVGYVYPRILKLDEEWGTESAEIALSADVQAYPIPARAHASRVRDIVYLDTNGARTPLEVIDPSEAREYASSGSTPLACYIRGSRIFVCPTPIASIGTLEVTYPARPGKLVLEAACGLVTSVVPDNDPATAYTIGLASTPSGWGSSDQTVDMVSPNPPFDALGGGMSALYDSPDIYVLPAVPVGVITSVFFADIVPAIGDWMCLAGESPIPQIPEAAHPMLAWRTAATLLISRGDKTGAQQAQAKANEFEAQLAEFMKPRVRSKVEVLVPHNSPHRSGFRAGRFGGWRGGQ